jgi:hypothetical protein
VGYTHSWELEKELDEETWWSITNDAMRLIRAWKGQLDDIRVTPDYIGWNSPDGEGFQLSRKPNEDRGWCKPGSDDVLMCAVLLVAVYSKDDGNFKISSDALFGSQPDRWPVAAKFASKVLGRELKLPWTYTFRGAMRGICARAMDRLPYPVRSATWRAQRKIKQMKRRLLG